MRYCLLFLASFVLTLLGAFQAPAVRRGVEEHFLSSLRHSFGIEVQGELHLSFFPFRLELEKIVFDPQGKALFKAESLTLGLGTFYLQLPANVEIDGNFWFSPSLHFHAEHQGEWGKFQTEGTQDEWKIEWEDKDVGSLIGYLSIDWSKERGELTSCEAAGTLFGRSFILQGSGELQHPLIDLQLLSAESDPIEGDLHLSLYRSGPSWDGILELRGALQGAALLSFIEGESLSLKEGTLSFKEGIGSCEAVLDLRNRNVSANLTLATDALPFLKGDLLAKASISSPLDLKFFPTAPKIDIHWFSHRMEVGPATLIDGEGEIFLAEEEGYPEWRLKGEVEKLMIGEEVFLKSALFSKGKVGELSPFSLTTSHEDEAAEICGEISASQDGIRIFFESIEGSLFHLPLQLKEVGFLSFHPEGWRLDRLHLKAGKTEMNWQGRGHLDHVAFQGELSTAAINEFIPSLSGSLKGTIEIVGPWSDLEGLLSLRLANVEMPSVILPAFPLNGTMNLRLKDQWALYKADLKGGGGEKIGGEGRFSLSNPFSLAGELSFAGELAPYLVMILPDTTSASGYVRGLFTLGGSLSEPTIRGDLTIHGGSYEDLLTGMICRQLEGDFSLNGEEVRLNSLRTFDRRGNEILATGEMVISDTLPFTLRLESKGAELLNLDYAVGRATGKVLLTGTREGGKLSGELSIDEMSIYLPEKTPILFQTLDVVYEKIIPIEKKTPWKLAWDLRFDVPNPVKIQGSAFTSQWKGDFNLQGTGEAPLLFGKGKLVDANFSFNGKTFYSHEGMILFQGEPGSKATFYITAKQELEDLKIDILLKGALHSPELSFRSKPAKSQREILSYLLFNRGLGEITPYEGEELTRSIIKLDAAATSSDPNILDRLKSGLGIDRIELSGEKDLNPDNVSLEVGKYLSPSLYFCLKKSVSDGPNQAAIEARLPHHFKAQAEVGDDAEGKFMLKWEHDY